METGKETSQVTQVTIRELADFCAAVAEGLRHDPNGAAVRPLVEEALSAECVQCGIRLAGTELLKLGEPTTEAAAEGAGNARVERLRIGYCARNGCESHYYRLTRGARAGLDWGKFASPAQELAGAAVSEQEKAGAQARRAANKQWNLLRIGAALLFLLVVLLVRQIYVGGRIPFIREPEQFRVDRE